MNSMLLILIKCNTQIVFYFNGGRYAPLVVSAGAITGTPSLRNTIVVRVTDKNEPDSDLNWMKRVAMNFSFIGN